MYAIVRSTIILGRTICFVSCPLSLLLPFAARSMQRYCEPTCKVWGSHTKSSSGLETWVSTTQDFSMGRVVIDAPVDLVADAVCADELRTTFNEKLEGRTECTG